MPTISQITLKQIRMKHFSQQFYFMFDTRTEGNFIEVKKKCFTPEFAFICMQHFCLNYFYAAYISTIL